MNTDEVSPGVILLHAGKSRLEDKYNPQKVLGGK